MLTMKVEKCYGLEGDQLDQTIVVVYWDKIDAIHKQSMVINL